MTPIELLEFMRRYRVAVEASVSAVEAAQAAVVGIAITDRFEVVFDALGSSRKVQNLRRNPNVALVIGGLKDGEERTVQFEGAADEPAGGELERVKRAYYEVYPDGPERLAWPGLTYVRVLPVWLRYSDFTTDPPTIVEFTSRQLFA